MPWASRRRWAISGAAFVLLLILGGWPAISVRRAFSGVYAATANLLFGAMTFGRGGHARLAPMEPTTVRRPGENVTSDARLSLTVDGRAGELAFGLSLRRDAYLPLLILMAAILAAPLRAKDKLYALLVGLPAVLALTIASLWWLVLWLFTHQVGGVYPARPAWEAVIDLLFRALLLPPGGRFLVPFLMACALVAWRRR